MSRLPTDDVLVALAAAATGDLDRIVALWPAVREQRRLGPAVGRELPTSAGGAGEDIAFLPPPAWADPTGEAATNANHHALEEHLDRDALHQVLHALMLVQRARQALCARLPAVDANVAAVAARRRLPGQAGTALTAAVVIGTRAATMSDCTLCDRPAPRVRGGWCDSCYSSWQGYKAGRVGADRDEFRRWRLASLAA